ncbi:MAG: ATP-binding protein [bacterium]|nr:ATP-binding protein [bacterium]
MASYVFFDEEFSSSLMEVGEVLKEAVATLREGDWIAPDQEFYARLCLEEALVNAVTHGSSGTAALRVRLEMTDEGDTCVIRVFDQGKGFTPEEVHLPCPDQEGGRGICLIRYCMDDVTYDTSKRCLVMRMGRKALCQGEPRHE